jgi:hypothetical protein
MTKMRTVVLVGHCGPDMHMLRTTIGRSVPGAAIVAVNSSATLAKVATPGHLLLVNRALDGDFDAEDGIELIGTMMQQASPPKTILISNYAEAQDAAVAAGASRGFGKTQLYAQATADALRAAIILD